MTTKDSKIKDQLIQTLRKLKPKHASGYKYDRFGSPNDGGYILIDDIRPDDIIVSLGIGDNVEFEQQAAMYAKHTIMCDPTVFDLPAPVPNSELRRITITDGIGPGTVSLEEVISAIDSNNIILKCDIEGHEWSAIESLSEESLKKIRMFTVEMHSLNTSFSSQGFLEGVMKNINKITKFHGPVAFHINNYAGTQELAGVRFPIVIEVTVVRKTDYNLVEIKDHPAKRFYSPNNPEQPEADLDSQIFVM